MSIDPTSKAATDERRVARRSENSSKQASLSAADAKTFARVAVDALRERRDVVTALLPDVMREIDMIREHVANDYGKARRQALAFALTSAQREFAPNVAATHRIAPLMALPWSGSPDDYPLFFPKGTGLLGSGMQYRSICNHGPYYRSSATVDRAELMTIPGFGHKTSAMAVHLLDANARCVIIDRHMLRMICQAIGIAFTDSIAKSAYGTVEDAFLDAFDTVFPGVPPFAVQWALWCVYGFGGAFVSHLPIFGL